MGRSAVIMNRWEETEGPGIDGRCWKEYNKRAVLKILAGQPFILYIRKLRHSVVSH